jgi:dethiobiotin synthetase
MLRGLFITGTGTGVGKTVTAAALMHRYRSSARLRYWKPVQTGIEQDDDTKTVRELGACSESELLCKGVRLAGAVSPHLAAERSGNRIEIADLVSIVCSEPSATAWIVEGAGGTMVPLNDSALIVDLMVALQLPVVVVSRSELGTINHTLLTLEALRTRSLDIAGVIMVGERNRSNREAIEHFGNVPVLGEMPQFSDLSADKLAVWANSELDSAGVMMRYF